jgi:hypothetical protein
MRRTWIGLVVAAITATAMLAAISCITGDDDDDSGGGDDCEADAIAANYPVRIEVTLDTCTPANVGTERTGTMRIVQGAPGGVPDTKAEVYFTEYGVSQEEYVFTGSVCASQVIDSTSETVGIPERACAGLVLSDYTLQIADAAAGVLSGTFSGSAEWSGEECADIGIDVGVTCQTTETVTPLE